MKLSKLKQMLKLMFFLTIFSFFILIILFAALALITMFIKIPLHILNILPTLIAIVVLFLTNYLVARILTQKGILIGLISGCVFSLIVFITTYLTTGFQPYFNQLLKIVIIMITTCVSGILGTIKSK